jgi:hypothetical protein
MKRLSSVLTISTLIAALSLMTSCKKNNTPSPSAQIVGKWTMVTAIGDYTTQGQNHKDTTSFTSADYFEFKADSTVSIMADEVAYNGKWKIAGTKLFITGTGYIDYPNGFDFPILTNTDLQLYYTESTTQTSLEQKLNLKR